jgi:hypothetical protein
VALSAGAAWLAITRFGLFDELPAASAVARQDIVDGMADAAIAVTDERRVVDFGDDGSGDSRLSAVKSLPANRSPGPGSSKRNSRVGGPWRPRQR